MAETMPPGSPVISESWASFGGRPSLGEISSPTHNKLSSRKSKTVEEVLSASKMRLQQAADNLEAQASARAEKAKAEREHEEAVRQRKAEQRKSSSSPDAGDGTESPTDIETMLIEMPWTQFGDKETATDSPLKAKLANRPVKTPEELGQLSQRKMEAAEELKKQQAAASAEKLAQASARREKVAERAGKVKTGEIAVYEDKPISETPQGSPNAASSSGGQLVMTVPASNWSNAPASARGADMHQKLSARTRKAPEEVMEDHKKRMAGAEALKAQREEKERERQERARERMEKVQMAKEMRADAKAEAAASKSDGKMKMAEQIARRKATRESMRAESKRKREKAAKDRQANATKIFGTTVLDDDDKLRLLKIVKANSLSELEEMASGGELGRLRNFQNHYGDSALILAAWYGHLDIAKLLLDANADVDIANCDGNTALNCAAYRGHPEMVELLIDEDSEVDVQDTVTGKTALIKSAYGGHVKVVEMLLEAEADPDAVDSQGYGALAFAASFGHREVLRALLEYDADPDVADQFGITPLIHAAARGDFLSVKMLLEAGATATKEDVEGKSAVDYADSAGFDDVVACLAEYAEKDPNSAGQLQSSAGATTQRIMEAENGEPTGSMSARGGLTSARGSSQNGILTPRVPQNVPTSNRGGLRPLADSPQGVGNFANGTGTPRGFRGMTHPQREAQCEATIDTAKLALLGSTDMKYLAKKLFNLSMLLEQDTVSEDVSYPKFAC